MKSLAMMLSLLLLLSSCFPYRNLTKTEPITRDFLSKLEPGKTYKFEQKVGETKIIQLIHITGVDYDTIVGCIVDRDDSGMMTRNFSGFSDTFENVETNVAKISVMKRNRYSCSPENPWEFEEKKYSNMSAAGIPLTVLGGILMILGSQQLEKGTDYVGDTNLDGIGLFFTGAGCLAAGIPLSIAGIRGTRKYNKKLQGTSVRLGLNRQRPGLSLTCRF